MEKTEKKKGNTGLLVFLIIVVIGLVVLSTLLFTGVIKSPLVKCETKQAKTTTGDVTEVTKEKTADERYKEYITNLAASIKKNYVGDYQSIVTNKAGEKKYNTSSEPYYWKSDKTYSLIITSDLKLLYVLSSGSGPDYSKVADDVVSYYNLSIGNGGLCGVYFITTDGTLHFANVSEVVSQGKQLEVKDLEYKNIVEVKGGMGANEHTGASMPIFVDIDGNVIMQ